ncbi:MAG: proprotein convertase P-domain-containing protein, partial [Marinirhabdus sp.]
GTAVQCSFNITVEDTEAPVVACAGEPTTTVGTQTSSPAAIIDGSATVVDVITVADDQTITDIDVELDINHTWVADLEISLTSPAGTSVVIFTGATDGCGGDDIITTLDDESANALSCGDPIAFPLADYMPSSALAAFDGESTAGDWTLSIDDTFPTADEGILNSWSLNYSYLVPGVGITLQLDANGEVTIPSMDLVDSATDNCGAVTVTVGSAAVPCGQSNPENAFENAFFNTDGGTQFIAEDLSVAAGQEFILEQVVASVWHSQGATITSGIFDFHEDAGGVPGAIIGSETLAPTAQTVIGNNFGFDVSEVTFNIAPFTFPGAAGTPTTYWVNMRNAASDAANTGWGQTTASAQGGLTAFSLDSGATWALDVSFDGVYEFNGICQDLGSTGTVATFTCDDLGDNLVEVTAT